MNIGKEIPDLPADDYRFMVTIMVDGHGRPSQLENEIRNTLERMLWNEFGEMATVTLVMRTDDSTSAETDTLLSDDPVVLTSDTDSSVVED